MINLRNQPPLIVNAAYRPPDNNTTYFDNLCTKIEANCMVFKDAVIWTAGDFNLPDINWNLLSLPSGNNRYKKEINERALSLVKRTFQE